MNIIYDFSNTSPNGQVISADYTGHGNVYKRTEASRIYLARPGKRMLGALNGIDESSCNLTIDFINADEISFDVYRYLGVSENSHNNTWYGYYEESSWYHYIDILMEIYVDGFGWFFIDESPTINNDGIKEYKSVVAKSYEYTLHQYDLETFDVNTAASTSREMIAEDNVYTYYSSAEVHYNMFRDRVLFYRNTSEHKALLNEVDEFTTYEELQELLAKYPNFVKTAWRIEFDLNNIVDGLTRARDEATDALEASHYQDLINNASSLTSEFIKKDLIVHKNLIKYLPLIIDKKKRKYDSKNDAYVETDEDLRVFEFVELEYKRIKDLSLLDLCLSDVPETWTIGYVDESQPKDENGQLLYKNDDGTPLLLKDETGSFEIDAQDVYTFMVNELAGYFNCVFQFDTMNNVINVYRIESIGKDTRIFLSFRNVENDVTITPAQELFTQFTVENSEGLGITNVNFGQREIEDISYFLKPEYLPQDLIDKYKRYVADRESKRDAYVDLSRKYNKQLEKCNEIINKVPSDMLNISQLKNFKSQEQLEESIANYYALLVGMLKAFIFNDTSGITVPKEYSTEDYASFDDYITAWNEYINALEKLVDKNNPAGDEAVKFADSLYYDSYCACRQFTIPNLVTAHKNLGLPSYEPKEDYEDAFEYIFDEEHPDYDGVAHYGDWYGINELKAYQKTHLDKMQALEEYVTPLEDIQDIAQNNEDEEERQKAKDFLSKISDDYTTKHDLYIKYKNGYESATRALEQRQKEYDAEKKILDGIYDERKLLADAMLIRNWSEAVGYTIYNQEEGIFLYDDGKDENQQPLNDVFLMLEHEVAAFTDAEVDLINRFYRHTDYSNDNINHLANIDTTDTDVDKELEMLKEARDELYAESHPQYSYSTSVDNLLANNEYASYHPEFDVGNFIRLGLDDETQVNLRMIKLSFNPMTMENKLDIEFSNMINYRGKRNDFANLLDSVITSAKNTITARYNRSADSDNTVQVTYDLVQKILQSAPFASYTTASQQSAVTAATGAFSTLSAEYTKTKNLDAEMARIVTLQSDSIFAHYLKTDLVVSKAINAEKADITDLATRSLTADKADITDLATRSLTADSADVAGTVKAENIDTSTLTTDSAFIKYLESNLVVASEIKVDDLKAKLAQIDTLNADSAFVKFLETDITTAKSLSAEHADVSDLATKSLTADKASITDLATEALTAQSIDASNINVDELFGESAFFDYLESNLIVASEIQVDDLKAKLAQIDTLTADSAFVKYLQGLSSTVAQSTITDAYIYNAVAGKITVADLKAGDIVLGNQMRILTNSGATEGMVMSGSELQFLDGDGNPSISIGYNTVSDGQGGTTVDYDHPAIIIKDENGSVMLNSSGLSQGDVGLAPMIQTASIAKNQLNFPIVDTDENGNISITNIKDGTGGNFGVEYTNFKQGTQDALDEIESKKMYRVVVESDNGNIFKNGDVNCTLSCRVYSWDDEITNDINAANFTWTRKSKNSTDDAQWNANHSGGTKTITITPSDVYGRSVFYCTVTLPDGTVQSSG